MKYTIKFRGAGSQEYVVEALSGFHTVKDIVDIVRINFGFKEELLVYDDNGIRLFGKNKVTNYKTFTIRRVLKEFVLK